jgi:Filamentous haemagglutinin family outer membrane protein
MQAALSTQGAADRSQLAGQLAVALQSPYLAEMQDYVRVQTGATALTPAQALDAFSALPVARQALFEQRVLFNELRQSGRSAVLAGSLAQKAADYQRGYDAMAALFSAAHAQSSGDILLPVTKVRTLQGSDINMLAPVGNVDGGVTSATNGGTDVGVVALGGGNVNATLDGNFLVNTSRVFTLGGGNLLMWSSNGNIDAGKGARTALGAPAPVYYVDDSGNLREDITAAISGSGIASSNELDVYAPHGIVDSGDAGLRAAGGAYLGALKVVCLGCSFSGPVLGLPSASPPVSPPLPPSALPDSTKSGPTAGESEEEKKKKKKKREIQIDFLGFGLAFLNPMDWLGVPGLSLWPAQAESTPVDRHVSELVSDQPEPQPRSVLLSWFDGFKQRLN